VHDLLEEPVPARAAYQREVAELERALTEHPGDRRIQLDLASACFQLGSPLLADDAVEAERLLRRSLELSLALTRADPGDSMAQSSLAFSHVGMGNAHARAGRGEEALAEHLEALALRERMAAADPANAPARLYVGESQWLVGGLLAAQDPPQGARQRFLAAARTFEALAEADPGNAYQRTILGQIHGDLGRLEADRARRAGGAEAADAWREARGWLLRSEESYASLRREGRLTPPYERLSAENARLLATCDAALGAARPAAGSPRQAPAR
jgi:tetratricopeptide (TPR) repeat protein